MAHWLYYGCLMLSEGQSTSLQRRANLWMAVRMRPRLGSGIGSERDIGAYCSIKIKCPPWHLTLHPHLVLVDKIGRDS